jgi:hypothetical protein
VEKNLNLQRFGHESVDSTVAGSAVSASDRCVTVQCHLPALILRFIFNLPSFGIQIGGRVAELKFVQLKFVLGGIAHEKNS